MGPAILLDAMFTFSILNYKSAVFQ